MVCFFYFGRGTLFVDPEFFVQGVQKFVCGRVIFEFFSRLPIKRARRASGNTNVENGCLAVNFHSKTSNMTKFREFDKKI